MTAAADTLRLIYPREDTRHTRGGAGEPRNSTRRNVMGLTIHWLFKSVGKRETVENQLTQLRSACLDLPFESVGELVWVPRAEIQKIADSRDHELRWAMIQAGEMIAVEKTGRSTSYCDVRPDELLSFSTWPGEGCEEANFFLARYPASVECDGRTIPTGFSGWRGRSFCKTQYASNVSVPHFLRCHLTVCAALEQAKSLKLLKDVQDEGDYWTKRDVAALAKEVGEWNEMIAGIAGALHDATGAEGIAPITEHPEFERLEHAGLRKPTTAMAAKKLAEIAKKLRPLPPAA